MKQNRNKLAGFIFALVFAMGIFPMIALAEGANLVPSSQGNATSQQGYGATGSGSAGSGAANTTYTPMEKIPGTTSINDFPSYVKAIYKFGIWTIGISALLMIMIGGFMYMTSAGNNATMGKAKGYIQDAIIGLIMAMTAWLLLNTINPDLVNIKIKFPSGSGGSSSTGAGGSGGTGGTGASGSPTGTTPTSTTPNMSNVSGDIQAKAREYAALNGVPENVALNMLSAESGGNPNALSSAGAAGLLQLMPGTAQSLGVTDSYDVDQNLNAGYKYADQLYNKYGDWGQAMAAYNWGPGNMDSYLNNGYGVKGQPMPTETINYVNKTTGSCPFCPR